MSRLSPELVGGFIGMMIAFGIGHWLNAMYDLPPWFVGETVCTTHGDLLACTGYMPLGNILIAIPLVFVGMVSIRKLERLITMLPQGFTPGK